MRLFIGSILSPLNAPIRKLPKLTALFTSLALCLCYAGGALAGSSVTPVPTFYKTFGPPFKALVTADGNYVLVSLAGAAPSDTSTGQLQSAPETPPAAGVQVFEQPDFTTNPCGVDNLIQFPSVTQVDGMQFLPAPRGISVGAAVEHQGAVLFNLSNFFDQVVLNPCSIIGGKENLFPVPQLMQHPKKCQELKHCAPGTIDLAITPNGEPGYAFVANEYGVTNLSGKVNFGLVGTIGIIRVQRNAAGGFTPGTRPIVQNKYIYIPGADTIPGITMSHDGKRLYVVNENAGENMINKKTGNPYWDPTNVTNTPNGGIQASQNCQNQPDTTHIPPTFPIGNNGLLSIIDVDKATKGGGQGSILVSIAAGCSPGRAVETADGKYIWVAARGLNLNLPGTQSGSAGTSGYQVLVFDVSKLLSKSLNDVNDALVGFGDSGGTASCRPGVI